MVVRAERKDVGLAVIGFELGHGARVEDVDPARDDVVRGRVVRTRVRAGCRSADDAGRIDLVAADRHRRTQAWRYRIGFVVGIPRKNGVPFVEAMVDTDVGHMVVLGSQSCVRKVVGKARSRR